LDRSLLGFPLLAFGLPLLGWHLWNRVAGNGRRLLLAGVLCPLVLLAAWRWDSRTPMTLAFEGKAFHAGLFGPAIPEDAQVFWDEVSVIGPWLTLGRADYFSAQQLSGVVFNRETARSGRERLLRVRPVIEEGLYCQGHPTLESGAPCRISDVSLHRACAPGPIPRPD